MERFGAVQIAVAREEERTGFEATVARDRLDYAKAGTLGRESS